MVFGFARRTGILIIASGFFIASGIGLCAAMVLYPQDATDYFPVWLGAGAIILAALATTQMFLEIRGALRQRRDQKK